MSALQHLSNRVKFTCVILGHNQFHQFQGVNNVIFNNVDFICLL